MFSQVTKEAKARMEGKAGGEGKTKRVSKEELLHPYSAKKINGERSDLEKVIIALLFFAWLELVFWSIRQLPMPRRKTIRVSTLRVIVMY